MMASSDTEDKDDQEIRFDLIRVILKYKYLFAIATSLIALSVRADDKLSKHDEILSALLKKDEVYDQLVIQRTGEMAGINARLKGQEDQLKSMDRKLDTILGMEKSR
jgi:hypothetical protein